MGQKHGNVTFIDQRVTGLGGTKICFYLQNQVQTRHYEKSGVYLLYPPFFMFLLQSENTTLSAQLLYLHSQLLRSHSAGEFVLFIPARSHLHMESHKHHYRLQLHKSWLPLAAKTESYRKEASSKTSAGRC